MHGCFTEFCVCLWALNAAAVPTGSSRNIIQLMRLQFTTLLTPYEVRTQQAWDQIRAYLYLPVFKYYF